MESDWRVQVCILEKGTFVFWSLESGIDLTVKLWNISVTSTSTGNYNKFENILLFALIKRLIMAVNKSAFF